MVRFFQCGSLLPLFFLAFATTLSCKPRTNPVASETLADPSARRPPMRMYLVRPVGLVEQLSTPESFRSMFNATIESQSNFPRYRRGLYLAEQAFESERYVAEGITGQGRFSPWIAVLDIAERCAANFAGVVTKLGQDPRFVAWAKAKGIEGEYNKSCNERSFAYDARESQCTRWVDEFFNHNPDPRSTEPAVAIATDSVWPNSGFWYLRDPSCVVGVNSQPHQLLAALGDTPNFWQSLTTAPDTMPIGVKRGEVSYWVVVKALIDDPKWDVKALEGIRAYSERSDLPHIRNTVVPTLDWAIKCQSKGAAEEFRSAAKIFIELSLQVDLDGKGKTLQSLTADFVGKVLPRFATKCDVPR